MKKHLIAAAVAAAVAVPVMAQVTISGVLDVSPQSDRKQTFGTTTSKISGTGNDISTGHAATNRINFTFTEDLGGGLKADGLYRLRYGDNAGTTGTTDDFSLRLSGGFGALRMGRFSGFVGNIEAMSGQFSATGNAGGIGSNNSDLVGGTMNAQATGITAATGVVAKAATHSTGKHDDTQGLIQYVSPSFSGLNVTIDLVNRTGNESTNAGNAKVSQQGFGLSYTAGPLQVQAAKSDRKVTGALPAPVGAGGPATLQTEATTAGKGTISWLAANYNLGPATVYVGTARRDDTNAAGAKVDDVTINIAGVQYRLGAITLFASMYDGEDKNTGVAGVATTEKRDLSGVQLAASYALSKRTSAYFVTGKNEDKGAVAGSNYKNEGTAIGVRHNF